MYLSSDSCREIYPYNTANDFRVKLPQTLQLHSAEKWTIAILDIDLPRLEDEYKPHYITLESSVCTPSVYTNGLRPVLQRLYFSQIKKGSPIIFSNPRYVPLNTSTIDVLDMYITDSSGRKASLKQGAVECTLHLVRQD